jgi:hypothetical protein
MTPGLLAAALTRVPDKPGHVDVRGMLLSGKAAIRIAAGGDPARDPFVVLLPARSLAAAIGRPDCGVLGSAVAELSGDVNVLCAMDDGDAIGSCLPGWMRQSALIHSWSGTVDWDASAETGTTIFTEADAPDLTHVPEHLRLELIDALSGRPRVRFVAGELPPASESSLVNGLEICAAWADGLPVAFCYPVVQTETLWDVSIDTLAEYRHRGLALRVARRMITRLLVESGKRPVWGALESNTASRALAARLHFTEAHRLTVFCLPPGVRS